jgi:hypothetical protein
MSKDWEDIFPRTVVYKLSREVSDHNSWILNDNIPQSLKELEFRFELTWLKQPEFLPLVAKIWKAPGHYESTFDKIQKKLKYFKQYFMGWGFNLQGEMRKKEKRNAKGTTLSRTARRRQFH